MNGSTILIVVAFIGSPVLGIVATKYLRPNLTPSEELQQVREDRDEDRKRLDAVETQQRIITDYVHQLRQHIGEGKGPPPPPWPRGAAQ